MAKEIVISASFSIDLLESPFAFWKKEVSYIGGLTLLPYNFIFQSLLDQNSLFYTKPDSINIILFRTEDIPVAAQPEFISALETYQNSAKNPLVLIRCPPSAENLKDSINWNNIITSLTKISFFSYEDIFYYYPLEEYNDPITDKNAHVPYKDVFFTVLTTFIVRKVHAMLKPPLKVVAVDCDNTLWHGVAAEVGAEQVEISPPFIAVQRFLLRLKQQGVLITLASHNSENDVINVFKLNSNMILKLSDLALWRVNWEEKSNTIADMAEELNLNLDSFAFIDDNPIDCQEVKAHLPQIAVFTVPQKIELLTLHNWYFDIFKVTLASGKRTQMYQENLQRSEKETTSKSFAEFIHSLNLEVKINPLGSKAILRAEELLARTNQFNTTHMRLNQSELSEYLRQKEAGCLTVHAVDKFGDYGFVGLILYHIYSSDLIIDDFLLSCRVLNRGVEFAMMNYMGQLALDKHCKNIMIQFTATTRNVPAKIFLDHIATFKSNTYWMESQEAKNVKYDPEQFHLTVETKKQSEQTIVFNDTEIYSKIAKLTIDYRKLSRTIYHKTSAKKINKERNIEAQLIELWSQILKTTPINHHITFTSMGGHSLQLLELLVDIKDVFGIELTLDQLFVADTIAKQAKLIKDKMNKKKIYAR